MQKSGLDLRLGVGHESVTKNDDGSLEVLLKNGEKVVVDKVLSCLGRPPNVEPLNLQNTGVEVKDGAVVVDEF